MPTSHSPSANVSPDERRSDSSLRRGETRGERACWKTDINTPGTCTGETPAAGAWPRGCGRSGGERARNRSKTPSQRAAELSFCGSMAEHIPSNCYVRAGLGHPRVRLGLLSPRRRDYLQREPLGARRPPAALPLLDWSARRTHRLLRYRMLHAFTGWLGAIALSRPRIPTTPSPRRRATSGPSLELSRLPQHPAATQASSWNRDRPLQASLLHPPGTCLVWSAPCGPRVVNHSADHCRQHT